MASFSHSPAFPAPCVGASVVGALTSSEVQGAAIATLGRRALRIASDSDVIDCVDQDGVRAVLFELGHPSFSRLCTRLSVVGAHPPIIVVLPPGAVSGRDLLALSRIASFSLAYDHREIGAVLRRTMSRGHGESDAHRVARSLDARLPDESSLLALGLYVAGNRNATVTETRSRLGFSSALRNRLRSLRLARASTIMGWSCALGIVWRMEREGRSLGEAAREAGFETTRQCSERLVYHTGRAPTALRAMGFAALLDQFVEVVRGHGSCDAAGAFLGRERCALVVSVPRERSHSRASLSRRHSEQVIAENGNQNVRDRSGWLGGSMR